MRSAPTPSEALLWRHLRGDALGVRFRRQVVVGPFIVDFYCAAARLVVEIDGGIHLAQAERDARRDAALVADGFRVVRVRDVDVVGNLPVVLARLEHYIWEL
ncbi:MAG TPA: endonuclease domain-containing protein [Polyangiaceae bacterium]